MIKHTLEISKEAAHVSVRHSQLILKRGAEDVGSIPCEDIGIVMVDHPQVTYSHAALVELALNDAAVVICGPNHLPAAMLLPIADHTQVVWRLKDQVSASKPLLKNLWKQIVQAKVIAQAYNLPEIAPARKRLLAMAQNVRSGDLDNIESQAAKVYWRHWLSGIEDTASRCVAPEKDFYRDQNGTGLNSLLNYGYAILRAGVGRAIVGSGLMPSLGIHHCNRSNAFCLADDLIEPLRPLVDNYARRLYFQGVSELDQFSKARLLTVLNHRVLFRGHTGPLMATLHRYTASLTKCYAGDVKHLDFPELMLNLSQE